MSQPRCSGTCGTFAHQLVGGVHLGKPRAATVEPAGCPFVPGIGAQVRRRGASCADPFWPREAQIPHPSAASPGGTMYIHRYVVRVMQMDYLPCRGQSPTTREACQPAPNGNTCVHRYIRSEASDISGAAGAGCGVWNCSVPTFCSCAACTMAARHRFPAPLAHWPLP